MSIEKVMGDIFVDDGKVFSVSMQVEEFKHMYLSLWYDTETGFPCFEKKYNFMDKIRKEKELNRFSDELANLLESMPEDETSQDLWRENITGLVRKFGKDTLEFDDDLLNIIFTKGYTEVTNSFIKEAKKFDSEIDIFDIFQAMRNVWIMNSIQIFLGVDVQISQSIFAYSMLYPYSDNHLDNPDFKIDWKREFSSRFRKRLIGDGIKAENFTEECIFRLVGMIEDQYPRSAYPQVYEALISIHDAQEKSLIQQRGRTSPYEKDIVGISFEKGGSSVLADGYLVDAGLSREQADFMFGYGVFLQLADDLQDIREDYKNGHMTIFSQLANKWSLDVLTNRLFHYIDKILNGDAHFSSPGRKELKRLIGTSCSFLIFEAVAKNKNLYSRRYIKEIQKYCMFRFSYMKRFKKKFRKIYSTIDINHITSGLASNMHTHDVDINM